MNYLRNYTRYDAKRRRLSLFAFPVATDGEYVKDGGPTHLRIYQFACNKKDMFSKKIPNKAMLSFLLAPVLKSAIADGQEMKPQVFQIPILSGDSVQYTFNRWARNNTYRKTISDVAYQGEIVLESALIKYGKMDGRITAGLVKLSKR